MTQEQGRADYGPLEFTVRRFQLAQLAEWALPAVPANPTLPVNGCFRVTVRPDGLALAASDQRVTVFAGTPAVSTRSEGEFFVPARKLKAMLAESPEGDVTVSVKKNYAAVTAGSASWSLRLPPADGYTDLPDLVGAQFSRVSREMLVTALTRVRHAVGKDDGRPAFTQVRIDSSAGVMYAAACGSSQFTRCRVPGFPVPLTVPGSVLDDLVKLLSKSPEDDVEVADTGPCAVFRVGPVTVTALKASAAFPDVDSQFLQPAQGNDMTLGVDKGELAAALRRVRINADASTSAVALIADSEGPRPVLVVTSRDADGNSSEEVIPAQWTGGRQLLVVNAVFLNAMLAVHPSAACTFRVGKERGRSRPPLLLEDAEAGVTSTCPQMPASLMGYDK